MKTLGDLEPHGRLFVGGCAYGAGIFFASLSSGKLWLLCLTRGVIGGNGVGVSFIAPVTNEIDAIVPCRRWYRSLCGHLRLELGHEDCFCKDPPSRESHARSWILRLRPASSL